MLAEEGGEGGGGRRREDERSQDHEKSCIIIRVMAVEKESLLSRSNYSAVVEGRGRSRR